MNYANKPELVDKLAAAYVVGTLRGLARRRFQRLYTVEPLVAERVAFWETRLQPLADSVPPEAPPARVWQGVLSRIQSPVQRRLETRLRCWQGVAAFTGALAAGLIAWSVLLPILRPPLPPTDFVALMQGQGAKPAMLVRADPDGRSVWVRVMVEPAAADRSYELWALPETGKPRSLGLVSAGRQSRLVLAQAAGQALADVKAMAISLEPKGGSPTGQPTGPVLYSGAVVAP